MGYTRYEVIIGLEHFYGWLDRLFLFFFLSHGMSMRHDNLENSLYVCEKVVENGLETR